MDGTTRSARGARWETLALAGAAGLGVALRVRAYLSGRSLWLDEAMLALNVCGRSYAGLLRPLDDNQGAPLGFLWLEKLAVSTLGPTEPALRLVPFLASLATLWLVGRFCARNVGRRAAAVGVGLAAVTPALVSYGGEAKQYGLDVAVGLLVLNLGADALRDGLTARRLAALGVAGILAVWLSHPSAFVLAGTGLVLLAREASQRRYASVSGMAAVSACWLASFGAHYLGFARGLQSNGALAEYWASAYLPLPPRSPADLRQYVVILLGLFEAPFSSTQVDEGLSPRVAIVAACAWAAGALALARQGGRERWLLAMLVAPAAFGLAATAAHAYPLRFRLALFTAGPTLLVTASGLSLLARSADGLNRALGGLLLAGLAFLPGLQAVQFLTERPAPHGARPVLDGLARDRRPGDVVLVDKDSAPPFRFYQRYGRDPALRSVEPVACDVEFIDPESLAGVVRGQEGRSRVWLVYSAHRADPGGREAKLLTFLLDQWGRRVETRAAKGFYAHLYDFGPGSTAGRRPSVQAETLVR